ncbi:hypothetical protein H6F76_07465 [Leptolyngbya sp. FACHB-321]|uniref:hypothetical protein n=1 Tax=Leptolyngbya sp. FACHB-321 TaxID=2692807 RepID=UPI001686BD68|nr:hypothetical protein [Leptolyngbya sp. FACHB-321]MBD2034869.1 hypothetical protein [Leptolyngbya sp. FACHB-321]
MPKLGDDDEAAEELYGARLVGEPEPLEPETLTVSERMTMRGIQAFYGMNPVEARQIGEISSPFSAQRSVAPNVQHWEIYRRQNGYCKVDGCAWLTFPLVYFQPNHDRVLIKFTVRHDQLRETNRWYLSLEGGDIIFGEVLELRQRQDGIAVTLLLHPESIETRAQAGDGSRYSLAVPTIRYRHRSEASYRRLERAGLLAERIEALEALRQELSRPTAQQPALCKGCRHLHGQSYGGTLMVCGMHPYGNGEDCSDFEAK